LHIFSSGYLHEFASGDHPVLNTFPQAPEFADPVRYNFSILFNDQPVISKLLRMTRWCNG